MPKLYYPTPDEVQGARPLNEQLWFPRYQSLLLSLANTNEGRDLLYIDPWQEMPYPIVAMGKNYVRFYLGWWDGRHHYLSDFRVGAKWGNVIRSRWQEVRKGLDRMNLDALLSLPRLVVLADGRRLPIPAGGTTSSFFPDPHPESTTVDGNANRDGLTESWADTTTLAGNASDDSGATLLFGDFRSRASAGNWGAMRRGFVLFLTSSIGSDTVDSGDFSFITDNTDDQFSQDISLVATTPASSTAIVDADYAQVGTTLQASNLDLGSINDNGSTYNVMALNADGLASINTSGVTQFGGRLSGDPNTEPAWSASLNPYLIIFAAEKAGTSTDPRLRVVHSGAATFRPHLVIF